MPGSLSLPYHSPPNPHFLLLLPRTAWKMQVVSFTIKNTFLNTLFPRSSVLQTHVGTWTALTHNSSQRSTCTIRKKTSLDFWPYFCTQGSTQEGQTALTSIGADDQSWASVPRKAGPAFSLEALPPPSHPVVVSRAYHRKSWHA